MSDYLSRLVERHLAPSAVRPRVTSRFESPVTHGQAWVTPSDVVSPAAVVGDRTSGGVADAPIAGHSLGIPADTRASRALSEAGQARDVDRSVHMSESRTSAQRHPAHPAPLGAARAATALNQPNPQLAELSADLSRDLAAEAVDDLMVRSPVIVKPASMTSWPAHATPAPAVVDQQRASGSAVPDVVQVHIGRVEVRAIIPPAEKALPASAEPRSPRPLSLDSYLGGTRRR